MFELRHWRYMNLNISADRVLLNSLPSDRTAPYMDTIYHMDIDLYVPTPISRVYCILPHLFPITPGPQIYTQASTNA